MKALLYAGVALLALALAVFVVQLQPPAGGLSDELLFADLENVELLNEVERIEVSSAGQIDFTAYRDEEGLWRLQQKGGYPIDHKTITKLLDSVASAIKLERKTDNPAYYGRLGLGDKDSRLLVISSATRQWQLSVGSPAHSNASGQYVRIKDEKDSWLINQQLFIPKEINNWLDRLVIHVEPREVSRLRLKNPRYEKAVVLVRDEPDKELMYENAPADEKATMGLEFSARQLTAVPDYFNFLDVVKREELQSSLSDSFIQADYETFSGLLLSVRAYETEENDHYAILEIDTRDPSKSTVESTASDQAAELQPLFKRWAYRISRSVYEDLDKDDEQFPGYDLGKELLNKEEELSEEEQDAE